MGMNKKGQSVHEAQRKKIMSMAFVVSLVAVVGMLAMNIFNGNAKEETTYSDSFSSFLTPSSGLQPLASFDSLTTKKCIVIGMLSMAENHELREWHRSEVDSYNEMNKNGVLAPHIILRFGVTGGSTGKPLADKEKADIIKLKESPSLQKLDDSGEITFTTRATFEMIRRMRSDMESDGCALSYYVRAQDNYVVSYKRLGELAPSLPYYLTYFGSIVTDYPTPTLKERQEGSFAQSLFPKFAYGGFYGFSQDLYHDLIMPFTERTVHRNDPDYSPLQFPHPDQAIGLAFFRSHTTIVNYCYVTGIRHFCSPNNLNCKDYEQIIAFALPTTNYKSMVSAMSTVKEKLDKCSAGTKTEPYFQVHHPLSDIDTKTVLSESCTELTSVGINFRTRVEKNNPIALKQLSEDDTCAEDLYLLEHPDVQEAVDKGIYKTGKQHYILDGWKENGNNFFCPERCKDMSGLECFESCDKERMYLQSYPDVKRAVSAGTFKSGHEHYVVIGREEGRAWSCLPKYSDNSIGEGEQCLELWKKFIRNTENVVKHWPVHGVENQLPTHRCKGLLLLQGTESPFMEFTLRTHRRYMGPDWIFYLVGPPYLTAQWREKYEGPNVKVVDIPRRFGNLSDYPREVNVLYRSDWLWNQTLQCEYIVNSHTDVFMFRSGIEDFLHHSFAGAPVEPEIYHIKEWRQMCVKGYGGRCGGAGGLSIRRRSYVLRAFQNCNFPFQDPPYSEDMWMAHCHMLAGDTMTLPHPTEGNRLSLGGKCKLDNPIGMHRTWSVCRASTCAYAIAESSIYKDLYGANYVPRAHCDEGEYAYHHMYDDYKGTANPGSPTPGWDHWNAAGRGQGRRYICFDYLPDPKAK